MKNKIETVVTITCAVIFVVIMFAAMFCSLCDIARFQEDTSSECVSENYACDYFTVIGEGENYKIVYANDTSVKYLIMGGGANQYGITPLYNADGTLQIYESENNSSAGSAREE